MIRKLSIIEITLPIYSPAGLTIILMIFFHYQLVHYCAYLGSLSTNKKSACSQKPSQKKVICVRMNFFLSTIDFQMIGNNFFVFVGQIQTTKALSKFFLRTTIRKLSIIEITTGSSIVLMILFRKHQSTMRNPITSEYMQKQHDIS